MAEAMTGAQSDTGPQSVGVRVFVVMTAMLSIGAGVLVVKLDVTAPLERGSKVAAAFFVLLLAVGELHALKWLKLHDGGEITPSWAFAFAIILLPAPVVAIVAMALACALGDIRHGKPADRVIFNASQTMLSVAGAALVLILLGRQDDLVSGHELGLGWLTAVTLAAVTMFVINGVFTCVVLALHEGTNVTALLRRGLFLNLMTDGALVTLAPIFVVVQQRSLLLLPLVVGIAGLVHYNTRAALTSEHEANHDELTELWNRRAFAARIGAELVDRGPGRRCALLLLDLDGFKDINDRLGHQNGDLVLAEIGKRLRASQQPGQVVARLGGDEFAVFASSGLAVELLPSWAAHLRADLAEPIMTAGFPVSVTASIGIANWPEHGATAEALFQAADLAMYGAKKLGNAVHVYRESELGTGMGRIDLLSELEKGLARGELEMWYQPQTEMNTGRVVAMEALIRWNHPRFGLVLPGDFMPVAEHTDLMTAITSQVVSMAISDAMSWRRHFPSVRVAVNTSARNLHDLGFPKIVADALRSRAASPEMLELEITENTVIAQPERTRAVLESLKELGVRLSIDDFGTGYSSLAHLRSLPVAAIKIDRTFVRDLEFDADDQAIVRSIIDLAHNLGLETVAEGVETQPATEMLRQFGCDFIQGYLVAAPMPMRNVLPWLAKSHRELGTSDGPSADVADDVDLGELVKLA